MEQELIIKARQAKTVQELTAVAKEYDYLLTEEQANDIFTMLHTSAELSDDEIASVSGGGCGRKKRKVKRIRIRRRRRKKLPSGGQSGMQVQCIRGDVAEMPETQIEVVDEDDEWEYYDEPVEYWEEVYE